MDIRGEAQKAFYSIEQQAKSRAFQASNELRNASQYVLRGNRTGRRYRVPFTGGKPNKRGKRKPRYYTASAPGEAPANRTGAMRASFWQRPSAVTYGNRVFVYPAIESQLKYPGILEDGTKDGKIKARPFSDRIKEKAMPAIRRIYSQPYNF